MMKLEEHVSLTPREQDVTRLLLEGLNVPEIAGILSRSAETVRVHVKHQHLKTRTHNLHSLALWAYEHRFCCVADHAGMAMAGRS